MNSPLITDDVHNLPLNQRLLDPSVNMLNATQTDVVAWHKKWQQMVQLRETMVHAVY